MAQVYSWHRLTFLRFCRWRCTGWPMSLSGSLLAVSACSYESNCRRWGISAIVESKEHAAPPREGKAAGKAVHYSARTPQEQNTKLVANRQ